MCLPTSIPPGKAGKRHSTRSESKLTELSNAQVRDAQRALERLAENGLELSLDRAIELALPVLRSAGSQVTVDKLLVYATSAKIFHTL